MQKTKNVFPANADTRSWIKTAILLGMGIYLTILIVSGNLTNYINIRFAWLAYVGAVLFFLLGLVSLYATMKQAETPPTYYGQAEDRYNITWGILAIVALPLILAVLIPSRPLGAEAITGGISFKSVGVDSATAFSRSPLDRNILDWLRAFNNSETPAEFNDMPVDVIGFVYREPNFLPKDFMVSRFTMSCCAADAFAIGLPVTFEDASDFTDGTWVRVQGELKANDFDDQFIPVLYATSVEVVEQPKQPYLYP